MIGYIGGNIVLWLGWAIMLIGIIWHLCLHDSALDTDTPYKAPLRRVCQNGSNGRTIRDSGGILTQEVMQRSVCVYSGDAFRGLRKRCGCRQIPGTGRCAHPV